jgi:site-specific recombinase XerD
VSTAISTIDQYARVKALVLDSVASKASRRSYSHSIGDFCAFLNRTGQQLNKASVQGYKSMLSDRGLASSTVNVRLAAVKKLAGEAADNGLLDPALAAGVSRVGGVKNQGRRAGNWLTLQAASDLIRKPDSSLIGKRDRAILALLVGCGLRRQELTSLTMAHVQQRDGRWVLLDVLGKGKRLRTIPMPSWAYSALAIWVSAAGITEGVLLRSLARGEMGQSMSEQAVADVVHEYSAAIGYPVAPHDLRRTFAKLCHTSGGAIEQIQISLGHSSIMTTERYLGCKQDLKNAPADLIGMDLDA